MIQSTNLVISDSCLVGLSGGLTSLYTLEVRPLFFLDLFFNITLKYDMKEMYAWYKHCIFVDYFSRFFGLNPVILIQILRIIHLS